MECFLPAKEDDDDDDDDGTTLETSAPKFSLDILAHRSYVSNPSCKSPYQRVDSSSHVYAGWILITYSIHAYVTAPYAWLT